MTSSISGVASDPRPRSAAGRALFKRGVAGAREMRERIVNAVANEWRLPERRIDAAITAAAVAVGLFSVVTLVAIGYAHYLPTPWTSDPWDHWSAYLKRRSMIGFLFSRHNEHYIPISRLLILADAAWSAADGRVLLGCSYLAQFGSALLLYRLAVRETASGMLRLSILGTILAFSFAAGQWMNFVCSFQVCFPVVFFSAIAAFWAVQRAVEPPRSPARPSTPAIAAAVGLALIAAGSMANGILVLPLLAIMAAWLRFPWRVVAMFAAVAVVVFAGYMGGDEIRNTNVLSDTMFKTPELVVFTAAYLGSAIDEPLTALTKALGLDWAPYRVAISAATGAVGLGLFIRLLFGAIAARRTAPAHRVALLHVALFMIVSAAMTAIGRLQFELGAVFASRYATPSVLFWACLLALLLTDRREDSDLDRSWTKRRLRLAALAASLFVGGFIQLPKVNYVGDAQAYLTEGEFALINGAYVPEAWLRFSYLPGAMIDVVRYFRAHRLASFSNEWTGWLGDPVNAHYVVSSNDADCVGAWETVVPAPGSFKPGVVAVGWGYDRRHGRVPERIVFTDGSRRIVGFAAATRRRPDLSGYPEFSGARVGWQAYLPAGVASDSTAFLVLNDGRTVCRAGSAHVAPVFQAAPASKAGDIAGSVEATARGPWVDTLPAGAPMPAFATRIWSSPAAATQRGVLRLGPLKAAAGASFGLPLITGAGATQLRVSAIERTTGEVLSTTNPPAGMTSWQLWRFDIPAGASEITFDYVIDNGPGVDAWVAVAAPRVIMP